MMVRMRGRPGDKETRQESITNSFFVKVSLVITGGGGGEGGHIE